MKFAAFFIVLFLSGCSAVANKPHSSAIKSEVPPLVIDYFDRLDSIYRLGSSRSDISDFLELMTDDVRYVHYNYDANFDLSSWGEAFSRIQDNGGYNKSEAFCTAITNSISGNSYQAIEYAVGQKNDGKCESLEAERMLIMFKFSENKIQRIEELW